MPTPAGPVLVLDIGTTRTKAAWYLGVRRHGPVNSVPTAGMDRSGTFDISEIIRSVLDVVSAADGKEHTRVMRGVGSTAGDGQVIAIAVTSFLSHVMYDADGKTVGPGLSWSFQPDPDALEACSAACRAHGYRPERPIAPELLAPRLVHLARQDRELTRRIARVLTLKDVVRSVLTGQVCESGELKEGAASLETLHIDWSGRDYSLMRDHRDRPILPVLSLLESEGYQHPETLLPRAFAAHHPAGVLALEPARRLELPEGIPVATGATDGTTAMYGGGVLAENRIVCVFGTTDVVMRAVPSSDPSSSPSPGSGALSCNAAVLPGHDVIGGSTSGSGSILRWAQTLVGNDESWESVPMGADGVLMAPGLGGERAPWNMPGTRGTIGGLTPAHTGKHIIRACAEALTFRLRMLVEHILADSNATATSLRLIGGGGNRSPGLDEIRALLLPWPVRWRRDGELSLCGAAIFAGAAAGADEQERNRILVDLCSRAADDTEEPREISSRETAAARTLYRNWREWITTVYGSGS
jgi:sugar (pentulose or hexulose) kinase